MHFWSNITHGANASFSQLTLINNLDRYIQIGDRKYRYQTHSQIWNFLRNRNTWLFLSDTFVRRDNWMFSFFEYLNLSRAWQVYEEMEIFRKNMSGIGLSGLYSAPRYEVMIHINRK